MTSRLALRGIALAYLGLLVAGPVAHDLVDLRRRSCPGVGGANQSRFSACPQADADHPAIAVPLNTVFGIFFALTIVRREFGVSVVRCSTYPLVFRPSSSG